MTGCAIHIYIQYGKYAETCYSFKAKRSASSKDFVHRTNGKMEGKSIPGGTSCTITLKRAKTENVYEILIRWILCYENISLMESFFFHRTAQKLSQSGTSRNRTSADMSARNGGFCGALQRAPPPMPPGLARRLANKENYGIGKVSLLFVVVPMVF